MSFVSAVLIAAGESSRMSRPKPLLPWRGVLLVEYQIASLIGGGASEVVVVLGHRHEEVAPFMSGQGVRHVLNPNYREGKTTSIKAGVRALDPSTTDIVLLAVDQPRPPDVIREVVESHLLSDALITSPRHAGHGGHPLVFSSSLRAELESITEEGQGVREILQANEAEVNEVRFADPIVRLDINTPEDYEKALSQHDAG